VAEERYGREVEYLPNEGGSFLICLNRPKVSQGNPLQPVRFIVFDVVRGEVVLEDSLENGDAYWLSNHQIEVRTIPGTISDEGEKGSGYMFDIRSGTRTTIAH